MRNVNPGHEPGRGAGGWLCRWVVMVGVALGGNAVAAPGSGSVERDHWAFREVVRSEAPRVRDTGWVRNDVDRFVLAGLEARGLAPLGPAEKEALLRRVTFDLTGLPPSPEERAAFLADTAPEALERVTERLLASPRYGERWGRHWMDVVRYADTAGDNADYPVPELHRYRDYIIGSFNADKPYDRFVREQLAGDVLASRGEPGEYADRVVATGFLALSRRYGTGPYELWHLTLENTLETVGQAFLGLNLKCARCHDHKFDPVSVTDYYGLYGIFASTEFPWAGSEEVQSKNFNRQKFVPLIPDAEAAPKLAAWQARMQRMRDDLAALEKEKPAEKGATDEHAKRVDALKKELRTLEKPGAPADVPVAYAVREGKPTDVAVQKRGEPSNPGPVAVRCVPEFLSRGGKDALRIPEGGSGRLEFAEWLTRPENPLTARVMVNRIWQHHFGEGLVRTPNNFGLRGDEPVHRELLDYLASRFVESGWSVKAMHRLILDSATYRLSSGEGVDQAAADPGNRLLWRHERRRLDAEAIRDAMLCASGELDLEVAGAHPFPPPEKWTWTQHTPFKERYESTRRSVYLMTQRFQRHPFLALFDGPDTNNSTEARRRSIVPQQALYAMNHPWVDEQARGLARRVLSAPTSVAGEGRDEERLRTLFALTWSREPSRDEATRWLGWLGRVREAAAEGGEEEAWVVLARVSLTANEFLYVD